jgi:hypothetical protein
VVLDTEDGDVPGEVGLGGLQGQAGAGGCLFHWQNT